MRELITVTVLTVNQTLPQLKAHIGACLNIGVLPLEIRETIYQCAPFIGFPKTLNAISAMNEVSEKNNFSLPLENAETVREETRYDEGEVNFLKFKKFGFCSVKTEFLNLMNREIGF